MPWWLWVLFGFVLLGLELLSTSLHLGFFGVGAIAVGLIVAAGFAQPLWLEWLLFTVISVAALLLFRQPLLRRFRDVDSGPVDALEGENAVAMEEIGIDGIGKAEMRGSAWSARNVGDRALQRGDRCRVERIEGLTIFIRPA
jgi:membrane protein implicated in regulation of membrane protease activity